MGGKRVYGYREGDRSEYLAQFLLSRFSYVFPSPRQEDFGIADFLCILAKVEKKLVLPNNGYYVQVKSNEDDIIYDKDSVNWISTHMDLPLLIGVIDKKGANLKLYSTSKIWVGLFKKYCPDQLTIQLNKGTDKITVDIDEKNNTMVAQIGDPILSLSSDEIENQTNDCYDILLPWLEIDKMNIARRSIGRIYCSGYSHWTPNSKPTGYFNQYSMGPNYDKAEIDLAQILTALAHNYKHAKDKDSLNAVVKLLGRFPDYLDDHGKKFVSGKFKI